MQQIKVYKYYFSKLLSILLTIVLVLSCFVLSGCSKDEDDGSGHTFTYALESNPKNLDPQIASDKPSLMIIENMFLGLMTFDKDNNLVCGAARDYDVSDDGLRYHFDLRDDCMWYSKDGTSKKVTAHDFVFAFKRIFNPVTMSPYRETFSFLQNAEKIINGEADYSELGVYAINSTELVFYLDEADSEFLYLLTTSPAMPCNKDFFDSTKARYGLDEQSVISNGAFYITQWFYDKYGSDNLIYMQKNYLNSEYDRVYPYLLKFTIKKNTADVYEQFKNETSDCVIADNGFKKTLTGSNTYDKYQSKSLGIIFNMNTKLDSTVRKALILGIDREKLKSSLNDYYAPAYGLLPASLGNAALRYREKYDETGLDIYSESSELSQSEAQKFSDQYDSEPSVMVLQSMDSGFMNQVVAQWQENLNLFISLDYVDDQEYYERLENGDYIFALAEIDSVNNSACSYLNDVISQLNMQESKENKFMSLTHEYKTDLSDDSMDILYEAENEILNESNFIPVFYKNEFLVSKNEIKDLIFNPFSGQINFRYAKFFD
ncbi:MAG: ABC transporter substrate-binding protein [Oscillospiraceae bacterium]|nr:ABC transporter substrate-binding protein [Oscillospiraceae bacterium]